jgi:hypothetical protein
MNDRFQQDRFVGGGDPTTESEKENQNTKKFALKDPAFSEIQFKDSFGFNSLELRR